MGDLRVLADEFWARVDKSGECWEWTGTKWSHKDGRKDYGRFSDRYAHRVAWELTNGPIPAGMIILHACDNPPCCNPAHLRPGTYAENSADMVAKGRQARGTSTGHYTHPERSNLYGLRNPAYTHPERVPRGESNGNAKLTEQAVRAIRADYAAGMSQAKIAQKYGVSQPCVYTVVNRRVWKHVP